jgi:hypothetical protein
VVVISEIDRRRGMKSTRAAVVAWSATGLILAVVATTSVLAFLNRESIHDIDQANLIEIVLPIGFALVGGLVAARLPSNPLGWVFLAISLASAIPGAATQYTRYILFTDPGAPFSAWIPWFGNLADSVVSRCATPDGTPSRVCRGSGSLRHRVVR